MSADRSPSRQVAVVDGANVAYEEQSQAGAPKVSNLIAIRRQLEARGLDPIVVVDASLRHEIDDPVQLEALFDDERVRQAPAGTDADRFVLEIAERFDALVVSNDQYEPYREAFPWLEGRRIRFMIVRGEVLLAREEDAAEQERPNRG